MDELDGSITATLLRPSTCVNELNCYATTTEGKENEAVVTVTLSADPERTVTIGITTTDQGEVNGSQASSADYSGVPANVVFNSGDTSKTFTFAATADTVDDDGESVKLTFNSLPTGVSEGTTKETVVSINDDDLPADGDVEFEQATYTVGEGADVAVTVTLSADPERLVTIPISKTNQGGASSSDYSGVPASVVFNSGDTSKTFTFAATADSVDDDGESVKLTFGTTLPTGVSEGTIKETVVSITDDDVPSVDVEFGAATYSVEETDDTSTTEDKENEAVVTVTLSADPQRTVTIPIVKANQGGASDSDYSGVPVSVTFNSGDISKTFTFAATSDTVDDDGESVKLSFGTTLPTGITEGTTKETVVSITDDDEAIVQPQTSVRVSYQSGGYGVAEGGTVEITLSMDNDPERTVTIPIEKTEGTGVTSSDYSGVPGSMVFNPGDTEKSFTFTAVKDSDDEDTEDITLEFGTLPSGVSAGSVSQTKVTIFDSSHVSFVSETYQAHEGGDNAVVMVNLNPPAITETVIPITTTGMDGASSDDWSGVPGSLTFNSGDSSKSFTVVAVDDAVEDGGESVRLAFGDLPAWVAAGTPSAATVELMNMENGAALTQCPEVSGRRIILDSRGEITETGVSQFWRIQLDPYRGYLIEVFGSSSQVDLAGDELPNETRTLTSPRVMSVQMGDRSHSISHQPLGNAIDLVRGSDVTGWHQIEVSGMGETGTYRIRVRVNNVCVVSNNRPN